MIVYLQTATMCIQYVCYEYKMLSYHRETALQGGLVILRTL